MGFVIGRRNGVGNTLAVLGVVGRDNHEDGDDDGGEETDHVNITKHHLDTIRHGVSVSADMMDTTGHKLGGVGLKQFHTR